MATVQFSASSFTTKSLPSFEGLRPFTVKVSSSIPSREALRQRSYRGLVVKAATVAAPKYTSIKPLGDRVLVKIKTAEEKSVGGILLRTSAQTKPQGGEVVTVREGRAIGKNKTGTQVVYSKYAGTEIEHDGVKHLLLKEDDIVGILDTNDVKDMKPLYDRVLIKGVYIVQLLSCFLGRIKTKDVAKTLF